MSAVLPGKISADARAHSCRYLYQKCMKVIAVSQLLDTFFVSFIRLFIIPYDRHSSSHALL